MQDFTDNPSALSEPLGDRQAVRHPQAAQGNCLFRLALGAEHLDTDLASIRELPASALRHEWVRVTGRVVPKVSPSMLRLAVAWEVQAKACGGLSLATRQRLDQLVRAKTITNGTQPGMRLVREWKGKLHIVIIGKDKVIRWDAREWSSLSEVARAITGTRWSGPAFFGLKQKRSAA